mgnify:CR=1 FL=1
MKKPKKTLRKPRLTDAKRSKKFAAERAIVAVNARASPRALADRKRENIERAAEILGAFNARRDAEAANTKADQTRQLPTEQVGIAPEREWRDLKDDAAKQAGDARREPTLNEQTLNALRAVAEEAQRRKARQAEERQSNITIRHSALAGSSAAATLLAHVNRLSERGAIFAMSEELLSDGTAQIVVSETREIPVFFSPAFYALRDASTAYDIRMLNASGARGTPA